MGQYDLVHRTFSTKYYFYVMFCVHFTNSKFQIQQVFYGFLYFVTMKSCYSVQHIKTLEKNFLVLI